MHTPMSADYSSPFVCHAPPTAQMGWYQLYHLEFWHASHFLSWRRTQVNLYLRPSEYLYSLPAITGVAQTQLSLLSSSIWLGFLLASSVEISLRFSYSQFILPSSLHHDPAARHVFTFPPSVFCAPPRRPHHPCPRHFCHRLCTVLRRTTNRCGDLRPAWLYWRPRSSSRSLASTLTSS